MSRGRLLALGGFLMLALLGVGAAAALSGEHVSSACDTATAVASVPPVIYGDGGTRTGTIAGASDTETKQVCVTATATDQTVTVTNNVTTTQPTPSGVIPNEGRACLGNCPTLVSNTIKFADISLGGYYNIGSNWTAATYRYGEAGTCYDNDDIELDTATCRANGWLVHDSSHAEIHGSYVYDANVGNVSYQNAFKQKILGFLNSQPWLDGIYFDNFAMDVCADGPGTTYPVYDQNNNLLWANDAAYQAAQISFIRNVGGAIRAAGKKVGVNARGYDCGSSDTDNGGADIRWMDQYAPYVDGSFLEEFDQLGGSWGAPCNVLHSVYLEGNDAFCHSWDGWQAALAHANTLGLDRWPLDEFSPSGDASQCRFLRGSQLLETDGTHGTWWFGSWDTSSDIWYPGCTDFVSGAPLGAKYAVSTSACGFQSNCHAWRRDFANGYVIVNPTWASVTVGNQTIPSGDAVLHQN